MSRNNGNRDGESGGKDTKIDEAKIKEEWRNKNGPVVIVAIAVLLIAAMAVAMKMCG